MPIVELDLLIALVNPEDKLHDLASEIFERVSKGELKDLRIAASALLEYELILRSRGYDEKSIREDLGAFRKLARDVPITSEVIVIASELRERYDLTYFDSLHAATALIYDGSIASSDRDYERVKGLRLLDPRDLI